MADPTKEELETCRSHVVDCWYIQVSGKATLNDAEDSVYKPHGYTSCDLCKKVVPTLGQITMSQLPVPPRKDQDREREAYRKVIREKYGRDV